MTVQRLHFVYNVEATPQALVRDFVHRLTDPDTYPCRLCDLTYGRFVKKPGWQMFVWSLPVKSSFYTRDGFVRKFPGLRDYTFPAVFAEDASGELTTFLSADEMASLRTLEALENKVQSRLASESLAAKVAG